MKKEQKILLDLLAKGLFKIEISLLELSDDEWKDIMTESIQKTVTRIAFKAAQGYNIPETVYNDWKMYSDMSFANAVVNEKDHYDFHRWMSNAGIEYVIIKGCASSSFYPIPLDRGRGMLTFLSEKRH